MEKLNVAVLGDSAMWGQGLNEESKFFFLASQRIAQLLGKEADIRTDLFGARTGAKILAAVQSDLEKKIIIDPEVANAFGVKVISVHDHRGTDITLPSGDLIKVPKGDRANFYDTYPSFFEADEEVLSFFASESEEVGKKLFGEIPNTFPTITYQVQRVEADASKEVSLVLIDGSVNDVDITAVLDSMDGPEIEKIDAAIFQFSFIELKKLLANTRAKFPNAVIILTGYYSPFSSSSDRDKLKDMAEYMSGKPEWQINVNTFLTSTWGTLLTFGFFDTIGLTKDADSLISKSIHRSEFAHTRGSYWLRKAVSELSETSKASPGLYFANPGFKPENSLFASNPFVRQGYKPPSQEGSPAHRVNDAALPTRNNAIPRVKLLSDFDEVLSLISVSVIPGNSLTNEKIDKIKDLHDRLDGPLSLIGKLKKVIDNPGELSNLISAGAAINDEIGRIRHAQIASFVHPNEAGAERYAERIVALYERHINRGVRSDLTQLSRTQTGEVNINFTLHRYGFDPSIGLRAAMQHMIVDSLAVELKGNTKPSAFDPFDLIGKLTKVSLNTGNGRRWRLNNPFGKLSTIDTFGELHLSEITQLQLEAEEVLNFSFSEFTFLINGKQVFHTEKSVTLSTGDKIKFDYPSQLRGLEVNPALINFGSVSIGQTPTRSLKLANRTGSDVKVLLAPPPFGSAFQWDGFDGILIDGEEKIFQVTFRSRGGAIQQGRIIVTSDSLGSPHSVGLLGKGPGGFTVPGTF